MQTWLASLGYDITTLKTASEDASFRRYFRLKKQKKSYIVMDAPPENEPCDTFVALATRLSKHGINAPQIFEQNMAEGYLVLSDFGDDLFLGLLNNKTVDSLYADAITSLLQMQKYMPHYDIPEYTPQLLNAEMELFKEWFIEQLLGLKLNDEQQSLWQQSKNALITNAIKQPQVFVHRDFHSRNLIKTPSGEIGIIDFQDAVKGSLPYDLVSLLRDCYIAWPELKVEQWLATYYQQAKAMGLLSESLSQFKIGFNLMGVQRHLKAIGIFSRLKLRDNKHRYIADIPRTLNYVLRVSDSEPSLKGLALLIDDLALAKRYLI